MTATKKLNQYISQVNNADYIDAKATLESIIQDKIKERIENFVKEEAKTTK